MVSEDTNQQIKRYKIPFIFWYLLPIIFVIVLFLQGFILARLRTGMSYLHGYTELKRKNAELRQKLNDYEQLITLLEQQNRKVQQFAQLIGVGTDAFVATDVNSTKDKTQPLTNAMGGGEAIIGNIPRVVPCRGKVSLVPGNMGVEIVTRAGEPLFAIMDGILGHELDKLEITNEKGFRAIYQGKFRLLIQDGRRVYQGQLLGFVKEDSPVNIMLFYKGEPLDPLIYFLGRAF